MRRWLVTLALAVVALPEAAGADGLRVERTSRTVTTSSGLITAPAPPAAPRIARLPASVELDPGAIAIHARGVTIRHPLGRPDGVSWIATVGPHVVVGYAHRRGGHADSIVAIDHTTGRVAWRRAIDSLAAAELVDDLLAVERAGALDVLDARTGATRGTTPLAGQGVTTVSRPATGDLYVKTRGDLVAIDRATGGVRWTRPASSTAHPTVTPAAVLDVWIDRTTHRYGIARYAAATGRELDSIDLGPTGGWYDLERVVLAPDGAHDVLVSAMFAAA